MNDDKTNTVPATQAVRQAAHYARKRARGLSRLNVWVPDARRDEFEDAVAVLYGKWTAEGLMDVDTA